MKIIKTRELVEAERLLESKPLGFAYATTMHYELRALSIDGLFQMSKFARYNSEPISEVGNVGGCATGSEGDALADIQQRLR